MVDLKNSLQWPASGVGVCITSERQIWGFIGSCWFPQMIANVVWYIGDVGTSHDSVVHVLELSANGRSSVDR